MKKVLKWLITLTCLLTSVLGLIACNNNPSDKTELVLDNEVLVMDILDEQELTYLYNGKKEIVWSVSDPTVASLTDGVIVALKQGQTTVTATAGKVSDSLLLTVNDVNASLLGVSVDNLQVSMYVDDTCYLTPTLTYNGKNVSNASFDFESSSVEIVTVSTDGVITANSIGETEVFVNATFFGKTTGVIVNVTVIPSGEIALNKDAVNIFALGEYNGETFVNTSTVLATVKEKQTLKNDAIVSWSSKNENVAIVEDGVITAVSSGSTEIVATYVGEDGVSVKAIVMVNVNPVASVLSNSVDVVKTLPIDTSEFFESLQVSISKVYLTDGVLNNDATVSNGKVDISSTGFVGDVTLVFETDKILLQVPICIWTALISSASELEDLLTATDGQYRLTEDLDLSGVTWNYESKVVFKGVFDGNGKTIENFAPTNCGLFSVLGNGAKISNINFVNAYISGENTSIGALAGSIQENAIVEIDNVSGDIVLDGLNCGGLVGLIYRNSSVTVKNCNLHVYASDTSLGKGAFVGSADGIVNMPNDNASSFISNLNLCGNSKTLEVDNSACSSINLIETIKPIAKDKLNYFDVILAEKTEIEFDVENVAKTFIYGKTISNATFANSKVLIPISQIEGYKVNSVEIVFEKDNGEKIYYSIPIEIGEVNITNNNKDLLKSAPKGTLILQEDIDLSGITWDTNVVFEGTLDGNGYAIKNLTTLETNGFYKDVKNALIKNVAFVNVVLGLSSGTIAYRPTGTLNIENVFIEVVNTSALGRVGAICERTTTQIAVNLTNVVIKMSNRNANASIYGYQISGTSLLTNVHCIGLADKVESVCNAGHGYIAKTSTYNFYSDILTFVKASKTLTDFLDDCIVKYFSVLQISQKNVTDLLSLTGNETILLVEDLDLTGISWESTVTFTGVFDGDYHTIKNLTSLASNGFFKNINGATIKNVAFTNVTLATGAGGLTYQPAGGFTVENVFMQISKTSSGGRPGAICERLNNNQASIKLQDVVISMPNTNSNEAIFGYALSGYSILANVHCIGLPNEDASVSNVQPNINKGASSYTFYSDINAFNTATKTLTDFLTNCVSSYLK